MYLLGKIITFGFYLSPWPILYLLYRFFKVYELKIKSNDILEYKISELSNEVSLLKAKLNKQVD